MAISGDVNGKVKNISVSDVLHVPQLRTNLLSIGKITDRNCVVIFDKREAKIINKKGETILAADRKEGLYYIREASSELNSNVVTDQNVKDDPMEVWHVKMGHLNVRDLIDGDRNGKIQGMNLGNTKRNFNCKICFSEKMTRAPFSKSERNSKLLEIIHTDVCGPMRVKSVGGARYIATFIDDYSRWCVIRLLKNKSDVLSAFKDFNAAAHTPQQNGVAERRNRTLMDMTTCLLKQSNLPSSFWGEAVNTSNYIRNRCPSRNLDGMTAFEKWTGKVPDVSEFQIFGSQVFTLNRLPTKGKLESRSKNGIFVGYSKESKGYRVWIPSEHRIDITRDVKFIELPKKSTELESGNETRNDNNANLELILSPRNKSDHRHLEENEAEIESVDDWNDAEDLSSDELNDEEFVEQNEDDEARDDNQQNVNNQRRGRGRPQNVRTGERRRPRKRYNMVNCSNSIEEIVSLTEIPLQQAVRGPDAQKWNDAITSEIKSIIKNDTWVLTDRPNDKAVIGSRLILRNKYKKDGTLDRRKARVVARGFAQRPGIDFDETFPPVARLNSIRCITATAAEHNMTIKQFDITNAYLNGYLDEKVLMEVPKYNAHALEQIVESENSDSVVGRKAKKMLNDLKSGNKVCLLKRALYGLRQAGRCWNDKSTKN